MKTKTAGRGKSEVQLAHAKQLVEAFVHHNKLARTHTAGERSALQDAANARIAMILNTACSNIAIVEYVVESKLQLQKSEGRLDVCLTYGEEKCLRVLWRALNQARKAADVQRVAAADKYRAEFNAALAAKNSK